MATLREAISIAKKEPTSDRSKKLMAAIYAGKMDSAASSEGIDLTKFKESLHPHVPEDIRSTIIKGVVKGTDPGTFLKGAEGIVKQGGAQAIKSMAQDWRNTSPEEQQRVLEESAMRGAEREAETDRLAGATQELNKMGIVPKAGFSADEVEAGLNTYKTAIAGQNPMGALSTGAVKGAASTVLGGSELVAKGLDAITKPITGANSPDFNKMEEWRRDLTTPSNDIENAGFMAEQVGEFLAPTGIVGKGVKGAEAMLGATKLPGLVKGAAKLGTAAALEGATAGAITAAQEGDINENTAINAAISAGMPFASAGFKAIKNSMKGAGMEQIAKLIKPDKNAYLFGKNPAQAVIDEKIVANNWDDLVSKISQKKNTIGDEIALNIKKAADGATVDITKTLEKNIDEFGKKVVDKNSWSAFADKVQQLTGKFKPDVKTGQLVKIADKNLTKLSAADLWDLQKRVGKLTQWTGAVGEKEANQQLHKLYRELGKQIDTIAPGTKELQMRYANMIGAEKSAIARKAVAERNTNLLSNLAAGGVAGTISPIGNSSDPLTRVGNAVLGILAPKVISSPAFKTRFARFLAKEGIPKKGVAELMSAIAKEGVVQNNQSNTDHKTKAPITSAIKKPG